jgi:hypothetical protein
VKCKRNVIPVIIEATGAISKSLRKYLSNVTGKEPHQVPTENSHIGHFPKY